MNDSIFTLFCTLGERLYAARQAAHPGARGHGLHDGFVLSCPGTPGTDANGNPILTSRHVVGILAQEPAKPEPDVIYRILNQPQYDAQGQVVSDSDLGWINTAVFHFVDTTGAATGQDAIDPADPACVICGKAIRL